MAIRGRTSSASSWVWHPSCLSPTPVRADEGSLPVRCAPPEEDGIEGIPLGPRQLWAELQVLQDAGVRGCDGLWLHVTHQCPEAAELLGAQAAAPHPLGVTTQHWYKRPVRGGGTPAAPQLGPHSPGRPAPHAAAPSSGLSPVAAGPGSHGKPGHKILCRSHCAPQLSCGEQESARWGGRGQRAPRVWAGDL